MKNLLRNIAFFSLLFATSFAFAQDIEEGCEKMGCQCQCQCPKEVVFLTTPGYTFEAEFTWLYFKPSCNQLHYAAETNTASSTSLPNWSIHDVKPKYHSGFDLGGSFVNHAQHTKLSINWTHFKSQNEGSTVAPLTSVLGPFFAVGPEEALYSIAKGRAEFQYDAGNLNYGILVNFGDFCKSRIFAGLGACRIKETFISKFSNPSGILSMSIRTPSSFVGVGPQIGMDLSYAFCNGFSLNACGLTTLFVGNLKNHTRFSTALTTLPNKQSISVQDRTAFVPGFEGKLGIGYDFEWCRYLVNLEGGFQGRIYLNALESTDISSEAFAVGALALPSSAAVSARSFERHSSNFALAGPYIKLNIAF